MRHEGVLVLVRHGQSTDNEKNLFSGWRNPLLTARGIAEAQAAGVRLDESAFRFDIAFTSRLSRAQHTLSLILEAIHQPDLKVVIDGALDERDYGDLSGLNKEEARSTWGSDQVRLWRKSYHAVPPGGESLAMTAARTLPFYRTSIEPKLREGQRCLVVAHGNSLRSIIKQLDDLSDDDIAEANVATAATLCYRMREDGTLLKSALIRDDFV